jgi:hypothetical protein
MQAKEPQVSKEYRVYEVHRVNKEIKAFPVPMQAKEPQVFKEIQVYKVYKAY